MSMISLAVETGQQRSPLPETLHPKAAAQAAANAARAAAAIQQQRPTGRSLFCCFRPWSLGLGKVPVCASSLQQG